MIRLVERKQVEMDATTVAELINAANAGDEHAASTLRKGTVQEVEVERVVGVGTTVEMGSRYLYDGMENDWATYRDENGEWLTITYGGGDMHRSWGGIATVDATPEVKAEWQAFQDEVRREANARRARTEAEHTAKRITRGVEAVVVKGRKVPVGTCGTVVWEGCSRFGNRCGIKAEDGSVVFTASSNVEVTVEHYIATMARFGYDIEAEATGARAAV